MTRVSASFISEMKPKLEKRRQRAIFPKALTKEEPKLTFYAVDRVPLLPDRTRLIKSGIDLTLPDGCMAIVDTPKDLLNKGVQLLCSNVIGPGYCGEIKTYARNWSEFKQAIPRKYPFLSLTIFRHQRPRFELVDKFTKATPKNTTGRKRKPTPKVICIHQLVFFFSLS